jgi:hypothetical protein
MTIVWTAPHADANPWSDEHWSESGQAWYLETHGLERARARARDAGSYLGAPASPIVLEPPITLPDPKVAPPPADCTKFAPVAVIRPGDRSIYELPDPKD